MKPLKHIEESKRLIDTLTYELKHSKNQKRDAQRINTIIGLVNSFDQMLSERYYTDTIEMLLYARIFSQLRGNIHEPTVDIHAIVNNIDSEIRYGLELKKTECINFLQSKEIDARLLQDEDTVFKPLTDWKTMLEKLINEFKLDIKWNKS